MPCLQQRFDGQIVNKHLVSFDAYSNGRWESKSIFVRELQVIDDMIEVISSTGSRWVFWWTRNIYITPAPTRTDFVR